MASERKAHFEEHGYIKVEGAIHGEELARVQSEVDGMIDRSQKAGRRLEAHWGGSWRNEVNVEGDKQSRSVLSIHRVHEHSATLAQLMFHPGIVDPVAEVVGSENLQLHHTLMHAKPPKIGAAFPLHQDYDYFPHRLDTMVAATLYLDDSAPENGCLHVIPGSNRGGYIEHTHDGSHHLPMSQFPLETATPVPMKAGDLLIFSYLTIHGSTPNTSDKWRRMLLFEYRSPIDSRKSDPEGAVGKGIIVRGVHPNPKPGEGEHY
ncbi:MAG: phytanoyl-CoA dioxygenase family protein [Candidatus Poribacteria bacterium]|nr:phytanoyl-CoA dioxygenase family protein [Candidatus Poribacteria bacterium]